MSMILQDLQSGLRGLRRAPSVAVVAVLTVAVGVGVNTTMFSIVHAVLMRQLPYTDPDRLVAVKTDLAGLGLFDAGFSVPEIDDLRARAGIFEGVSPTWVIDANVTGGERPERIVAIATGHEYFQLLGVPPQLGRAIGPQDWAAGFSEAAVLSDAAWRRIFGGEPSAIGRQVRIDTDLYTIVGVMPPGFRHPAAASVPAVDAWLAAGFKAAPFPSEPSRRSRPLPGAIARLKPGISLAQAGAALEGLSASIRRDHPADYPDQARWSLRVAPLGDEVVGRVDRILLALSGAVALVLLIACANVANLLLARSSSRQTEMAIRLAVGAERGRLVRQLLTESLVLASVGGAAGVAAAYWAQPLLMAMLPSGLPRLHEIGISASVLAFGVGITILASGLSGIVPALQASKAPLVTAIAEGGRAGAGGARQRGLRTALVVAEIALSLVLVTGAGLLLKTVTGLLRVDPGFTTEHVMVAKAWIAVPNNPDADRYRTAAARTALARSIVSRLREIPEVASAALTTALPLSHAAATVPVQVEGQPNEAEAATAGLISVTPDYFSILQIPLIRGRWFVENDEVGGQLVAIVDEAAARRLFAGEDPLGRRIQVGRPGAQTPTAVVVGIVRDAKYRTLDAEPAPHIYVPLYQRSGRSIAVVVRTRVTPDGLHDEIERAVQQADADLPVFGVEPLGRTVSASVAQQRFSAQAVTAFAVLAIVLAAIGVYGVMACAVTTRTREIGLRMAIGATPGMVLTSVLGDSLRAALTGVALGLVLSAMVVPFIRAMLFGVAPIDPLVFVSSSLLLVAAALAAAYIPARRAARVDPLLSLRHM